VAPFDGPEAFGLTASISEKTACTSGLRPVTTPLGA